MIKSKDNTQIKHVKKLMNKAKLRREEGLFVIEGFKSVEEAIRLGLVTEIYVSEALKERSDTNYQKWDELSASLIDNHGGEIPISYVSTSVFNEVADTVTPQGILAVARVPVYDNRIIFNRKRCRILCLEDVRDPGNIGTMIRTAEGAGMDGILLSPGCADVFQPKVVRSTMGSILRVPCLRCETGFTEELDNMKKAGFKLYAAHLKGDEDYREPAYTGRVGILIGNEASGLSDEATKCADHKVIIPMRGEVESLNAAVSAALLMYETLWEES